MANFDFFHWMVQFHLNKNLRLYLDQIDENGVLHDSSKRDTSVKEGVSEIGNGFLLVRDGNTLVDRLTERSLITGRIDDYVHIGSEGDFSNYIGPLSERDGAFLFDSVNNRIARVPMIRNTYQNVPEGEELEERLAGRLPLDFVVYGAKRLDTRDVGTKTRLSVIIPMAFPEMEALQVKRSSYAGLLGKVTRYNSNGLVEEFFFKYEPQSEGPFIVDEGKLKIVGVYRRYEAKNGSLVRVLEQPASISGGNIVLPSRDSSLYAPRGPPYTPNENMQNMHSGPVQIPGIAAYSPRR